MMSWNGVRVARHTEDSTSSFDSNLSKALAKVMIATAPVDLKGTKYTRKDKHAQTADDVFSSQVRLGPERILGKY